MEVLAGHAASGVDGKVYEHRELLPMSLLREGLERVEYGLPQTTLGSEDSTEEGSVHLQAVSILHKAKLLKPIHEETHA